MPDARCRGDAADHGRRHVELSLSAGHAFGDCVVRYEEVRLLRQPLEITVVAVGVTREHDDPAAYADTRSVLSHPRRLRLCGVSTSKKPFVEDGERHKVESVRDREPGDAERS